MPIKIYLIEDIEQNILLVEAILYLILDLDCELHTETNGDVGFDLIKSGDLDLIITDITHSGMWGDDLCRELWRIDRFKDIPIIAYTALALKGDKERILDASFTEYVSKPIDIDKFAELIKKYTNAIILHDLEGNIVDVKLR